MGPVSIPAKGEIEEPFDPAVEPSIYLYRGSWLNAALQLKAPLGDNDQFVIKISDVPLEKC